jgi:hypothetical protein
MSNATASTVLASKTITGTHILTGKALSFRVEVLLNPGTPDLQGRWTVTLNGKPIRWYAMESAAMACFRRAKVGGYGLTFGEAA